MKALYLLAGFACVVLGAVGVFLPVLPTVPFLLLAAFCLGKGSERWHRWFTGTRLYKNNLEDFVRTRSMTRRAKLRILLPVTALLVAAALLVGNAVMWVVVACLLLLKYYYFIFRIRTHPARALTEQESSKPCQ